MRRSRRDPTSRREAAARVLKRQADRLKARESGDPFEAPASQRAGTFRHDHVAESQWAKNLREVEAAGYYRETRLIELIKNFFRRERFDPDDIRRQAIEHDWEKRLFWTLASIALPAAMCGLALLGAYWVKDQFDRSRGADAFLYDYLKQHEERIGMLQGLVAEQSALLREIGDLASDRDAFDRRGIERDRTLEEARIQASLGLALEKARRTIEARGAEDADAPERPQGRPMPDDLMILVAETSVGLHPWPSGKDADDFQRSPERAQLLRSLLEAGFDVSALRGSADFSGADLQGAKLADQLLRGLDFRRANFSDADLFRSDLREADIQGATFARANLEGASLQGADLRGAKLPRAYLSAASLKGANLAGADLREAFLEGTDLAGANLANCDLRWAGGLDPARLRQANNWESARYDLETREALGLGDSDEEEVQRLMDMMSDSIHMPTPQRQ